MDDGDDAVELRYASDEGHDADDDDGEDDGDDADGLDLSRLCLDLSWWW